MGSISALASTTTTSLGQPQLATAISPARSSEQLNAVTAFSASELSGLSGLGAPLILSLELDQPHSSSAVSLNSSGFWQEHQGRVVPDTRDKSMGLLLGEDVDHFSHVRGIGLIDSVHHSRENISLDSIDRALEELAGDLLPVISRVFFTNNSAWRRN
ncbi:MAG: hypothetical protein IH898_09720 [Planctomycetes bacterium]|nr:hypothetical protein [Planctomycetota bacterium]